MSNYVMTVLGKDIYCFDAATDELIYLRKLVNEAFKLHKPVELDETAQAIHKHNRFYDGLKSCNVKDEAGLLTFYAKKGIAKVCDANEAIKTLENLKNV